jgi:hypothetical protein
MCSLNLLYAETVCVTIPETDLTLRGQEQSAKTTYNENIPRLFTVPFLKPDLNSMVYYKRSRDGVSMLERYVLADPLETVWCAVEMRFAVADRSGWTFKRSLRMKSGSGLNLSINHGRHSTSIAIREVKHRGESPRNRFINLRL